MCLVCLGQAAQRAQAEELMRRRDGIEGRPSGMTGEWSGGGALGPDVAQQSLARCVRWRGVTGVVSRCPVDVLFRKSRNVIRGPSSFHLIFGAHYEAQAAGRRFTSGGCACPRGLKMKAPQENQELLLLP